MNIKQEIPMDKYIECTSDRFSGCGWRGYLFECNQETIKSKRCTTIIFMCPLCGHGVESYQEYYKEQNEQKE